MPPTHMNSWVTEYEGRVCEVPSSHIYRCVHESVFSEDTYYMGAHINIDDSIYEICGLDNAECGDGMWHLVYVHLVPDSMAEKDWHELYGNS